MTNFSLLDEKFQVLLQFKEEYHAQKIDIEEGRNRYELLLLKYRKLEKNLQEKGISSNEVISFFTKSTVLGDNDSIRREYNELLEKILSLNVECKSKGKTKFLQALDYIKAIVKVLDIQKLYKEFFEGQITNLNERVNTAFNTNKQELPLEKEIENFVNEDEFNEVEIKGTLRVEAGGNKKKPELKNTRLYSKIFDDKMRSTHSKPQSDRSNNSSASKQSKYSKISSKYLHLK